MIQEHLDRYRSPQQDVLPAADLGHEASPEHVSQPVAAVDESRRLDVGPPFLADRKTSTSRDTGLHRELTLVSDITSKAL